MESLELQRVARWIEEKEGRLFSRRTFKADARLDNEGNFLLRQPRRKFFPIFHGKNCTEMTHGHQIAVHVIMCFVSGLIRA